MQAWFSLVKKEFRVGVPIFVLAVILYIVALLIVGITGYRFGYTMDAIGIMSLFWGAGHFFFIAIYMLYSLGVERKRLHLWLHNPMHAGGLLTAKLLTGTAYLVISLLLVSIAAYIGGLNFVEIPEGTWFKLGMLAFIHVVLVSIDFSIYIILAYCIFLFLERYMPSFLSGTVVFIGSWLFIYLFFWLFGQSEAYLAITEWGSIDFGYVAQALHFDVNTREFAASLEGTETQFYIGNYVIELITVSIIFFIASWLLDKKVEV
jgi:hypothetical protein